MDGVTAAETAAWLPRYVPALAASGRRVLELGCGRGEDAALLLAHGFAVVACDRHLGGLAQARANAPDAWLCRVDLGAPLPFADEIFDNVLAALSLHYLPWAETLAMVGEIRRVLRPGGRFLLRVNASDDVDSGAGVGVELEPGFFVVPGRGGVSDAKRFFDEGMVRALLADRWEIEQVEHRAINRYGAAKRVWECLARAS